MTTHQQRAAAREQRAAHRQQRATQREQREAELELSTRIQDLPQEMRDNIWDYFVLLQGVPEVVDVGTSRTNKPTPHLAINNRTRQRAIPLYYGNGRVFAIRLMEPPGFPNGHGTIPQGVTSSRLMKWLRSLTSTALSLIRCICPEETDFVNWHLRVRLNDEGNLIRGKSALIAQRKHDFLEKLEERVSTAAPLLRPGVLRMKFESKLKDGSEQCGWLTKEMFARASNIPASSDGIDFWRDATCDPYTRSTNTA